MLSKAELEGTSRYGEHSQELDFALIPLVPHRVPRRVRHLRFVCTNPSPIHKLLPWSHKGCASPDRDDLT
jgi:hypothetical protein